MILLAAVAFTQQPASMADDPRLQKPPAVRAEARSLADVLKGFQTATGVAIEAQVMLRDELVTLWTADKSAAESLAMIAKHFGWEWQSSNGGYFLVQTQESKRAEEAKRREFRMAEYVSIRDSYRKALEKLKTLDVKEYEKHLAELEKELQKNPANEELRKRLYEQYATNELSTDPISRFCAEVMVSLSDAKLEELARRSRIVLNYYPTASQSPLGRGTRAAEALVAELGKPVPKPDPKEVESEDYVAPEPPITSDMVGSVRIAIDVNRGGMWSATSATVAILAKSGGVIRTSNIPLRRDDFEAKLAKRKLDEDIFTQPLKATDELKERLSWKPKDESDIIIKMIGSFFAKNNTEPLAQSAWLVTETAKSCGLPVIADAYDTHTTFMMGPPQIPAGKTAAEVLSSTINIRQSANLEQGWLRIRDEDWQLARAITVPRRILFPLRNTYIKQGGMSMDQLGDMASRITDLQAQSPTLQISTGVGMTGIPFDDPGAIYMLRFWDGLTPFQKRALISGSQVDMSSLMPAARANVLEYLYRLGANEDGGRMGMMGFEDEEYGAPASEVSIPMEGPMPIPKIEIQPDSEITQVLPNGPRPGAAIGLQFKSRTGIGVAIGNDTTQIPFSVPIAAIVEFTDIQKEMPSIKIMGARPAMIATYEFSIFCSQDVTRKFQMATGWSDPIYKYGPLDSLPTDILTKLKQLQKKREDERRKREEPPPPSR